MAHEQHGSDVSMDLVDDSHITPVADEEMKSNGETNSTAVLPNRHTFQAAKKKVSKKGNKTDVPTLVHAGIKDYFRSADPATTDRKALFGFRRIAKILFKAERRVVVAAKKERAVVAQKQSKRGRKKQKNRGKRKKEGMNVLMGMMGKLHVGERAEVERRKQVWKKNFGLVFQSRGSKKRMLQRLRDNDLEGE
jgi:hypothetical protein